MRRTVAAYSHLRTSGRRPPSEQQLLLMRPFDTTVRGRVYGIESPVAGRPCPRPPTTSL